MSARELLDRNVDTAFFGGFPSLRPVQEAAVKPVMEGRNVVACSGTGSGKTEAAVAPLVSKYWDDFQKSNATVILYIAPTKALVNDLARRLEVPLGKLGLRFGVRHGDRDDVRGRKKSPHIVVTTPESLDVMLFRGDVALRTVRALVIDEVHLLYNTQRGVQLSVLIERLKRFIDPAKLQLVALSATIADLKEVGKFFFGEERDTEVLDFPAHRSIDAQIRNADFGPVVGKLSAGGCKCKLLAFTNRRKDCEGLAEIASEHKHLAVFTHYSSLSKETREEIEERFQLLGTALCNATSTLELGIDIGDIDAVLLCSVPAKTDSFLQRIGRGNRRSNKTVAICFAGMDENGPPLPTEVLRYTALISAAKNGSLAERRMYELFGAVAQQSMSIIASRKEFVSVKSLESIFGKLSYLDRPALESILTELARKDFLIKHGVKNQYGPGGQLHKLVKQRRIYGNFPISVRMLEVRCGTEVLGEVPQFSVEKIGHGSVVKFAANKWRITEIGDEAVQVEPADPQADCTSFEYGGRGIGFETFLNEEMWRMIHAHEFPEDLLFGQLRDVMGEARRKARGLCGPDGIPTLRGATSTFYFTFAGALVNEAVALITEQEDFAAGDHWLQVNRPIEWGSIPTDPAKYEAVFDSMFHPSMDQSIFQLMLPPELQVREYVQEWLKDQAVPRVLARLASAKSVTLPSEEGWPFA